MNAFMIELIGEIKGLRSDLRLITGAVLNADEASAYLGISKRKFYEIIKTGSIRRVKLSDGRFGYRREELDRFTIEHEELSVNYQEDEKWYNKTNSK